VSTVRLYKSLRSLWLLQDFTIDFLAAIRLARFTASSRLRATSLERGDGGSEVGHISRVGYILIGMIWKIGFRNILVKIKCTGKTLLYIFRIVEAAQSREVVSTEND